jgi:ribA/ribD-fused uncharacterized protein
MCNVSFHERCFVEIFSPAKALSTYREKFVCSYCDIRESERFREDILQACDQDTASYLREISSLRSALAESNKQRDKMRLAATASEPKQPPPPVSPRPEKVRIVKGEWDPLSNFYPFTFLFRDVIFSSSEKAYQYFKALRHRRLDLCQRIQDAKTALQAKWIGKEIPDAGDEEFKIDLMAEILDEKSKQCRSFRDELRSSSGTQIMHSTYRDKDLLWTTGLDFRDRESHYGPHKGHNLFGKQLEGVRSRLMDEKDYDTRVDVIEDGECALILFDGERPVARKAPPRPKGPPQRRPQLDYASQRRQRICYYCARPGHIARNCWTKRSDDAKCGGVSLDKIRDPIIRSRMRRWRDSTASTRPTMTFHRSHQPAITVSLASGSAASHAPQADASAFVDDLVRLDDPVDMDSNASVSSNSSVITVVPRN